ncbi:MAG: chemotaxis protein CheA [Verrucomicrobiota bacterium]|nr:chemotaxis protein CheA [Verrucomicrobiota bacterium]
MNQDSDINAREFFARFMDDYYADCEDHLRTARRRVLELERLSGESKPDRAGVDDLFRCFHTIKGLSGMVSLVEAERLAHQLEAILAALRDGRLAFSSSLTSEIEAGVHLLEQIISAKKANGPIPSIDEAMARLTQIVSGVPKKTAPVAPSQSPFQSAQPAPQEKPNPQLQAGESCWLVTHIPSKELLERGLSVDKVRTRLNEIGRLLQVRPRAIEKGVAFDFTIATKAGPSSFDALRAEGLECKLLEAAPGPLPPEPHEPAPQTAPPVQIPPPPPATEHKSATRSIIVRVELSRLDDLMRLAGELLTSKARLTDQLRSVGRAAQGAEWAALHETSQVMDRHLRDLREAIMRVRLVPIGEAFERMQFVVRDLMRETGKRVQVEIQGQHTEIDKLIVERMMEPLLHIVRNAISHGIEPPEERIAAGKSPEGTLRLSASASGDTVALEIEDDGRGINLEKVAARARAMGLMDEKSRLDEASLLDILCAPGFSTRDGADLASGRGIGMNVVLGAVREFGGKLALHTEPGKGTRFTIELPITLLIADVLVVEVAGQTMAIAQPLVREVIRADLSSILALEADELLPHRGMLLPLVRVSRCFNWESPQSSECYILLASAGGVTAGLVVDRILGQREILVRPLADPLVRVPGISGATELGDGRVILILDPTALALMAHTRTAKRAPVASASHCADTLDPNNRVA